MGKVPDDLPETDTPVTTGPSLTPLPLVQEELNSDTELRVNRTSPANTSRDYTPPQAPPSPITDSDPPRRDPVTAKSDIPALDHFPAPPVHFPLPHLQRVSTSSRDGPVGNPPSYGRQVTSPVSPVQEPPGSTPTTPTELAAATAAQTLSPATNVWADVPMYLHDPSRSDHNQATLPTNPSATVLTTNNTEFGIRQPHTLLSSDSLDSSSLPKETPRSSGVVLAMRNRFSQNVSHDRSYLQQSGS